MQAGLASVTAVALTACANEEEANLDELIENNQSAAAEIEATALPKTPQCDDHDETPSQKAGPFYTPDTPERSSLIEAGMSGTALIVSGQVLTTDCQPVAGVILDFWHADITGKYDNEGFTFRGHQFTDENGRFQLEILMPGLYPGRTRHIHVHVQCPETELLTTQLYFPDEADNDGDGIFNEVLIMEMADGGDGGKTAVFNFVL